MVGNSERCRGAGSSERGAPPHRLESTHRTAVVAPELKRGAMYGVVPYEGMPDYVPFHRWTRATLGPPPGVSMDCVTTDWKLSATHKVVEGDYWYGGYVWNAFGHFATETISRVWWHLQNYPNAYTAVFIPSPGATELRTWQREAFRYFDIEDPLLLQEPTEFENLVIPQQGGLLFSEAHEPEYQRTLHDWNLRKQGERKIGGKVFLSRLSASSANVIGEVRLAECFSKAGYKILELERLSFEEQLKAVRGATHVVGPQGSAFHVFNMLGYSPASVLLFQRLGESTGGGLAKTLAPYVASVSLVPSALRFSARSGSNHDVTVLDTAALVAQTRAFDPEVDLSPYLSDPVLRQISYSLRPAEGLERRFLSEELAEPPRLGKASSIVNTAEKKVWQVLEDLKRRVSGGRP